MSKKEFPKQNNLSADCIVPVPRPFQEPDYPVDTYYFKISMLSMLMVRWHWHEEVELILVKSGEAWVKTEDSNVVLKAGQAMFVNQNLLHSIRASGGNDGEVYSLRFHPSFLFGSATQSLSSKYLAPLANSPYFKYLILDGQTPVSQEMLQLIRRAVSADLERPFGYELEVKSLLSHFWFLLLPNAISKKTDDSPTQVSGYDSIRIKTAIRYIEEHHADSVTLEEIAGSIHISKSECCRCFKRTLGITPFEYLMKYRIFESARKMQQKEAVAETISDLAASVGFNSPSYFNKIFKKYLKCTPLQYKRKIMISPAPLPEEDTFLPIGSPDSQPTHSL